MWKTRILKKENPFQFSSLDPVWSHAVIVVSLCLTLPYLPMILFKYCVQNRTWYSTGDLDIPICKRDVVEERDSDDRLMTTLHKRIQSSLLWLFSSVYCGCKCRIGELSSKTQMASGNIFKRQIISCILKMSISRAFVVFLSLTGMKLTIWNVTCLLFPFLKTSWNHIGSVGHIPLVPTPLTSPHLSNTLLLPALASLKCHPH